MSASTNPRLSLNSTPNQPNAWEAEFISNRERALKRRRRQEKHLGRKTWLPLDGEGKNLPKTNNIWHCAQWKTVYTLWDPIKAQRWPPRNVQLSDCWVYLAVKLLTPQERATRYSADFDKDGNIRPSRVPCGNPPIIYAHGLYCLPVYKLSYVLCGEKLAEYGNWIMGSQKNRRGPAFTLGLVCVPPEIIPEGGPTIERHLYQHYAPNQWDIERPETEDWKAKEAQLGTYDGWCLPDSDYGAMVYSMNPTEEPNYAILPVHQVNGFTVLCHPEVETSDKLLRREPSLTQSTGMTGGAFAAQHKMRANGEASASNSRNNDEDVFVPKAERRSPTLQDPFEQLASSSKQPVNIPAINHTAGPFQDVLPKTGSQEPELSSHVKAMVDRVLPNWPSDMDGVRDCLKQYLQHLQVDTEVTLRDVEEHAEAVHKYLRWRREMEEWKVQKKGKGRGPPVDS